MNHNRTVEDIADSEDTAEEAPTISDDLSIHEKNNKKVEFNVSIDTPKSASRISFAESKTKLDWNDVELDTFATHIQSGYRGMTVREHFQATEEQEARKLADKSKQIEDHLGIDLNDPDVVKATTKLQAGFRGAITRKNMKNTKSGAGSSKVPEIVVRQTTESESEYTYTYVEEDENELEESEQNEVNNFRKQ